MTKFLALKTKLKAFPEGKFNVSKMMISKCVSVENIVGERGNACKKHFLLFLPQYFQKLFFKMGKTWDCVVKS